MVLDLRGFRYFAEIAKAGSFSRAAEQLHIAQPALSVQIKAIEESLGVQLFLRTGKGVVLTAAGERFLISVNDVLRMFESACESAKAGAPEPSGDVAIGVPQSTAKVLTVPLVRQTLQNWPRVRLKIIEMNTGYITGFLKSGLIDIGITFLADSPGFQYRHLADEELCVVGPAGHFPAASHRQALTGCTLKGLENLPLILPTAMHSLRRIVDDQARRHGLKFNVVAEVNSIPQMLDLAAAGLGFSILAYGSAEADLRKSLISASLVTDPPLVRKTYLCRSAEVAPTHAATEVEALILNIVREQVMSGGWSASLAQELVAA